MNELHSNIRELLVAAEKEFGAQDAFRYKVKEDDGSGKKAVKVENNLRQKYGLEKKKILLCVGIVIVGHVRRSITTIC